MGSGSTGSRPMSQGALTQIFRPVLLRLLREGTLLPPLLPDAAREAVRLSRKRDVTFGQCAQVVEQDPGLVVELLKVANSSYYARRNPCNTLVEAFSRLGLAGTADLLLAASVARLLVVDADPGLTHRLQERSLAVALVSRSVASAVGVPPEHAYLAGLVHDVGWSMFFGMLDHARDELPREILSNPAATLRIAAVLHGAVGAEVARQWRLSPAQVQAIAFHHDPARATDEPRLAYVVGAAIRICDSLGIYPESTEVCLESDPLLAHIGLTGERLEHLLTALQIVSQG